MIQKDLLFLLFPEEVIQSEVMMKSKNVYIYFSLLLVWWSILCNSASLPPVSGTQAMVASSQHLASEVGINILKHGGNAIDAAVAMGYALAVVEPCCGNIGGGGFMLIHLANGKNTFINFREKAPLTSNRKFYLNKNGDPEAQSMKNGYLPVAVPGTVAGLNYALQKYGTLPLKEVITPAINLAENGYILQLGDVPHLIESSKAFSLQPNVAAIFLKNGRPYQVGDRLVQKHLASTLRDIASSGTEAFYKGTIADQIVKANKLNGGLITYQDLKEYTVAELKPVICNYRGYQIISAPPPGSGVTLCEILNITRAYPLGFLGYRSAKATQYIVEAMHYAYRDDSYLGDPDFVKNPVDKILSPAHTKQILSKINDDSTGNSNKFTLKQDQDTKGGNTTHYSIVDKYGNAVSVTYSLNFYFGAKVIPGNTGFFLNNQMDDFTLKSGTPNDELIQSDANLLQPGKRPLSSMTPTIVMKNNRIFMVLGAPGGSTIMTQILETLENVIDYGMNIQEAIDAPRYHMQWSPDVIYMEPYTFSVDTLNILQSKGYHFKIGPPYKTPNNSQTWGAIAIVLRDPQTEVLYGAIDSRRPAGLAVGY